MPESDHKPPMKEQKGTPRPNLADLMKIPKQYRMKEGASMEKPEFSLVNEKQTHPMLQHIKHDHDYTRDELIVAIGKAYPEMVDLLKELDSTRGAYVAMRNVVADIFYRVMTRHMQPTDENVAQIIGDQATFGRQCMDVIRNIALHAPADKCKEIAKKFIERYEPVDKGEKKIVSLVDEKKANGEVK